MSKKILVVDDEPLLVALVKLRLESQGYEVVVAYDGVQALEAVKHSQPDMIVLDIMMPAMKGDEVCRRLRTNQQTKNIPIVVLTGSQHREFADLCLECGADEVLLKPFDSQELLQLIKKRIAA